jgi:protein-tyrosine-phosphatase
MSADKRVLFVCTGNTCRSPMAEGMLRAAVKGRADIEVRSAGVAAIGGGLASPETLALLEERGVQLDGFRSRPVDSQVIDWATHVFAMTRAHLDTLARQFPAAEDKLFLVCEFVDLPGRGVGADVPDPIGMGRQAYGEVAETLAAAIPGIIGVLDRAG